MLASYLNRVLRDSAIVLATVVVAHPSQSQVPESLEEALEMVDQAERHLCAGAGQIYATALTNRVNQVHLLTALESAEQLMDDRGWSDNEFLSPDFAEIIVMGAYDADTSITHLKGLEESEYESAIFEAENEFTHQCIASDPLSPMKDIWQQLFDAKNKLEASKE
jgi:hypothetical protein